MPSGAITGGNVTLPGDATRVLRGDGTWGYGIPVGALLPFAGAAAPAGFLLCDGSAVSRSTYADLFAVLGVAYGPGNGSTTFNLPDLRGRVPAGRDAGQSEFDVLGETGGAKTHTLSTTEIPSHAHGEQLQGGTTGSTSGTHVMGSAATGGALRSAGQSTLAAGGGGAHNNLQPYQVVNFIVKT